jgi:hypothetical protein
MKRSSGVTSDTNFFECLTALMQKTQAKDASHGNCQTNTRCPHRSVNHAEVMFHDDAPDSFEVNNFINSNSWELIEELW